MGTAKWKGVVGIVRVADATTEAAPNFYPNAQNANIEGTPVLVERENAISRIPLGINPHGRDYAFEIGGIETPAEHFGYLMWLALGLDTFGGGQHVLTPSPDSNYCNVKVDDGLDKGSSVPTESLLGARIGRVSFEMDRTTFGKTTVSGLGADLAAAGAALTASIPTGANERPISWAAVQAGDFKLGYPSTPAQDNDVRSFGFEFTQAQEYTGQKYGNDQPDGINEGSVALSYSVTREFLGANALLDYNAWKANTEMGLIVKFVMGSFDVQIEILHGHIEAPIREPIGSGAESIMGSLRVKAFADGSDPLIRVTVTDALAIAYS